jgi:hypothetical protein
MTVRLGLTLTRELTPTLPNASLDTECGEVCPNGPKERRRSTHGKSAARCVAQKSPRNEHLLESARGRGSVRYPRSSRPKADSAP